MPRTLKSRSYELNSRRFKDVTRDFASTEMIWQKNLRRSSTIGRSQWRHEPGHEEARLAIAHHE
jgi:hypothetical protein